MSLDKYNFGGFDTPDKKQEGPNRERRREALNNFKRRLDEEGWVTGDLGDYCADCWEKQKDAFEKAGYPDPYSFPTSKSSSIKDKVTSDGYFTKCVGVGEDNNGCKKEISENL